jgi:hypothetical protein
MKEISVDCLIVNAIIAVTRRQPLSWGGCGSIAIRYIGEQVSRRQRAFVADHTGDLSKGIVIVSGLEDRAELFGRKSQIRLYLIDAGRARPKAALGIDATQNEVE